MGNLKIQCGHLPPASLSVRPLKLICVGLYIASKWIIHVLTKNHIQTAFPRSSVWGLQCILIQESSECFRWLPHCGCLHLWQGSSDVGPSRHPAWQCQGTAYFLSVFSGTAMAMHHCCASGLAVDIAVSSWDKAHPEPEITPVFTRRLLLPLKRQAFDEPRMHLGLNVFKMGEVQTHGCWFRCYKGLGLCKEVDTK